MPFDATVTFDDGTQHVYKSVPDGTAPDVVSAQAAKDFGKSVKSLDGGAAQGPGEFAKESLRVGAKAVQEGLTAFPGIIGDGAHGIKNLILDKLLPEGQRNPAVMAKIQDNPLLSSLFGSSFGDSSHILQTGGGVIPKVEPQTPAGKRIGSVGSSIVSSVTTPGGGTVGANALMGLVGGTGAEVAGAATDDNPIAKILAAFLTTAGWQGAARVLAPNAKELIKDATAYVSPNDWKMAAGRQMTQQGEGIPALASQNVPNSTLPDIVAQATTNPRVGPGLKKAVEGSPQAAAGAMGSWVRQNLPLGKGLDQPDVLNETQRLAEQAIQAAQQRAGSAYGANVPEGLNESNMDPTKFKSMVSELEAFIQRPDIGPNSDAGKAVRKFIDTKLHVPGASANGMQADMNQLAGTAAAPEAVTKMGNLNQFYKELNQLGKSDDFRGLPVQAVRGIMKEYTPEFQAARDAWKNSMENDYRLSAQGLTGDLANFKGGQNWDRSSVAPEMLGKIFGGNRDNSVQLERLASDIGDEQVGALLREHISRILGNTIKEGKSNAASLQTPADFTSALAGNPVAKKNIETALQIAARGSGTDPEATAQGFWKVMDALNTTKNLRLPDYVDPGVMADIAGKNATSAVLAPRLLFHRLARVTTSTKTYQEIADMVTSPNGLKIMEGIANEKDPARIQQVAKQLMIEAAKQSQDQSQQK